MQFDNGHAHAIPQISAEEEHETLPRLARRAEKLIRERDPSTYPPIFNRETLNSILNALYSTNALDDPENEFTRFIMRIAMETLNMDRQRPMFEQLRVMESILVPITDEHRVRQQLVRFRAKQPLMQFSLCRHPDDRLMMVLTRTA